MNHNIKFITDFHKSREKKIGSSDIIACLPHPERAGSVYGYDRTALTVYQEKCGLSEPDFPGDLAEFGSFAEPFIVRKFLKKIESNDLAQAYFRGFWLCELDQKDGVYKFVESYQSNSYLHHTVVETDFGIAHPDCINPESKIIVEAKSRTRYFINAADQYNRYDLSIEGSQGIPLRDYIQVQYQAALAREDCGIKIDELYLAALFDRDPFHFWKFRPDEKIQTRLLEIAHRMKQCIDSQTPPREYAMNQKDIKLLYPAIEDDYTVLSGDEADQALRLAKINREAKAQKKIWEAQEKESADALSILLKSNKKIKCIVDGQMVDIAAWQERKGYEKVKSMEEIKKNMKHYRYMKRNKLIEKTEDIKYVSVKWRGDDE